MIEALPAKQKEKVINEANIIMMPTKIKRPRTAPSSKSRVVAKMNTESCYITTSNKNTMSSLVKRDRRLERHKHDYNTCIPKRAKARSGFRGTITQFVHNGNLSSSLDFAKIAGYINSRFGYNIIKKGHYSKHKYNSNNLLTKNTKLDKLYSPFILTTQTSINFHTDLQLTKQLN